MQHGFAQPILADESVLTALPEAYMEVHAVAGEAVEGLGHERGVQTAHLGDCLHSVLEAHDVVGGFQSLIVAEVDLVLRFANLVVENLRNETQSRHVERYLPPYIPRLIQGHEVEVAASIGQVKLPGAVLPEEVELRLGADVGGEALPLQVIRCGLQNSPRVNAVRLPILVDVAVDPRYPLPGDLGVGARIGFEN